MKSRSPIDTTNRALLILLCLLLVARGVSFWPTVELYVQMRVTSFRLSRDLASLRSAVIQEQRAGRISASEANKLFLLGAKAQIDIALLSRGAGVDAQRLLEQDQNVIHSVCSLKRDGIDPLTNPIARAALTKFYLKDEDQLRAVLAVLASRLNLH